VDVVIAVSTVIGGVIVLLFIIIGKNGEVKEVYGAECPDDDQAN